MNKWDVFVMKTDRNGKTLWVKSIAGTDQNAAVSLASLQCEENDILIGGSFVYGAYFGNNSYIYTSGEKDGFIAKLDAGGRLSWALMTGSRPGATSSVLTVTSKNGYLSASGSFSGVVSFEGHTPCEGKDMFVSRIVDDDIATDIISGEGGQLRFWPNPATHRVAFSGVPASGKVGIEVYDQVGQLVLSENFVTGSCVIDVSSLTPGVYSLRVAGDGKTFYSRMVKAD
jgi:hypothetical protein